MSATSNVDTWEKMIQERMPEKYTDVLHAFITYRIGLREVQVHKANYGYYGIEYEELFEFASAVYSKTEHVRMLIAVSDLANAGLYQTALGLLRLLVSLDRFGGVSQKTRTDIMDALSAENQYAAECDDWGLRTTHA